MNIEEWLQLTFMLLPPIFVFYLKNKKFLIVSLIIAFDPVYQAVNEVLGECFYCSLFDMHASAFFYIGNFLIGVTALILLLRKNNWVFVRYEEAPSKALALKKTRRFYGFVLFLLFVVCWLTFFFGNSVNDLIDYVIPFVVAGPYLFLHTNLPLYVLGACIHIFIACLYYGISLIEMKSRVVYLVLRICFYVGLALFYVFAMLILGASATI